MHYSVIPVTDFSQNCTVFWCAETKKAAVVDPGGDIDKIISYIEKEALSLEKILLTHGHLDHVGGVAALQKHFDVPIEGPHIDDKFWIDALDQQAQMFGFAAVDGFVPDRWLEQGDTVTFGKQTLQVIHCPGHTPGHVVFYNKEQSMLQVGDVLFKGSIGRTDFPQGNHSDLIASIKEKLLSLGDAVEFIPGHGPMSNLGFEKNHNPHLQ